MCRMLDEVVASGLLGLYLPVWNLHLRSKLGESNWAPRCFQSDTPGVDHQPYKWGCVAEGSPTLSVVLTWKLASIIWNQGDEKCQWPTSPGGGSSFNWGFSVLLATPTQSGDPITMSWWGEKEGSCDSSAADSHYSWKNKCNRFSWINIFLYDFMTIFRDFKWGFFVHIFKLRMFVCFAFEGESAELIMWPLQKLSSFRICRAGLDSQTSYFKVTTFKSQQLSPLLFPVSCN